MHRHAGGADRMALGLQAAGRVDRQPPALLGQALAHHAVALAGGCEAHRLVLDQLGDGEAIVGLHEGEVLVGDPGLRAGLLPGHPRALELRRVAAGQRQDVVDVGPGAEADRPLQTLRRLGIRHHQGRRAVRDQRAVGAPQGCGHVGVLLRDSVAEVEAEILPQLRVGIADAVAVVLGGDPGQLLAAVAVALEIARRDPPEHAGEAALDLGFLLPVGGAEQDIAGLGHGLGGHLLGADHQGHPAAAAVDEIEGRVERRRAGGAGILEVGRRRVGEARPVHGDERALEALLREAGIHRADVDAVDLRVLDAGMSQRLAGDPGDQALDIGFLKLAEGRVGPAHNAGARHPVTSCVLPRRWARRRRGSRLRVTRPVPRPSGNRSRSPPAPG